VLKRWQGWLGALVVTLVVTGLVIADLSDARLRLWWDGHALTTDTVSGVLVLLVTLLVVDQLVRRQQVRLRSRAVAAQAAIVVGQASRSAKAVQAAMDGSGERDAATDEVRTYMLMLLVSAPVLIDAPVSRNFLEQAQYLGGELFRVLTVMARTPDKKVSGDKLDEAVRRLRDASGPLLQVLDLPEQLAASQDEGS
jgi:hypothetical protein